MPVPRTRATAEQIAEWTGAAPEFIAHKIGIPERGFLGPDESVRDLAAQACRNLADQHGLDLAQAELLILVTQNPDNRLPHTSAILQKRPGTRPGHGLFRPEPGVFGVCIRPERGQGIHGCRGIPQRPAGHVRSLFQDHAAGGQEHGGRLRRCRHRHLVERRIRGLHRPRRFWHRRPGGQKPDRGGRRFGQPLRRHLERRPQPPLPRILRPVHGRPGHLQFHDAPRGP